MGHIFVQNETLTHEGFSKFLPKMDLILIWSHDKDHPLCVNIAISLFATYLALLLFCCMKCHFALLLPKNLMAHRAQENSGAKES